VMIRRLKANVLSELPSKRRHTILVDADPEIVETIQQSLHHALQLTPGPSDETRGLLSQLYLATGRAKLKALKEYLKTLLDSNPHFKVLVFLHHLELMDQLQEALEATHTPHIRIDGLTEPSERALRVERFQRLAHIRVALLSLTCGNHGYNLTQANRIVFGEIYWTPGTLLQAEDRAHRIGQNEEIEVHYLLAKGTLDDIIWPMISRKLTVVGTTLNGRRQILDVEERIDLRTQLLLQELAEDPIQDAPECPRRRKKHRDKNNIAGTHTVATQVNNVNNDDFLPRRHTTPTTPNTKSVTPSLKTPNTMTNVHCCVRLRTLESTGTFQEQQRVTNNNRQRTVSTSSTNDSEH
jgi:hypothetical protein